MFISIFVPPALLGIVGLNPLEIIISGGVTLGFLAVIIGSLLYTDTGSLQATGSDGLEIIDCRLSNRESRKKPQPPPQA